MQILNAFAKINIMKNQIQKYVNNVTTPVKLVKAHRKMSASHVIPTKTEFRSLL
jgi:hypothetical protein